MCTLIRNSVFLVGVFIFSVYIAPISAQEKSLNEHEAKAHYVYETIKHITWPNDENLDTIRIGVVTNDRLILDAFNNLLPANGIRDKRITIEQISLRKDIPYSFNIVYLTEKFRYHTFELVSNSTDTLIINEGNINRGSVMVNFGISGRQLEVRINRDNLVDKGFKVSNSFLDFAGTKEELSDQLKDKQQDLSTILQRVKDKENELERLNQHLQKQSDELKISQNKLIQQEQNIIKGQNQLTEFKQQIELAESKLLENQLRVKESLAALEESRRALEEQQSLIKLREVRIEDMSGKITENQAVLDIQKSELKSQKTIIDDKTRKIQEQQKLLIIVSGVVLVFLVMAYFLIRLNILRERANKKLENLNSKLYELATTDGLTDLFNRRHFVESTETHLQHHLRSKSPAVMLMLDIDHFKKVNDTHGHAAGDEAIISSANVLKNKLRPYDIVGRLGGEEFAMMLLDCTVTKATEVAERLRQQIETTAIIYEEKSIFITISIGISSICNDDKNIDDVLVRADKALYEAKNSGRNCIKVCENIDNDVAKLKD